MKAWHGVLGWVRKELILFRDFILHRERPGSKIRAESFQGYINRGLKAFATG